MQAENQSIVGTETEWGGLKKLQIVMLIIHQTNTPVWYHLHEDRRHLGKSLH
jgi:hypothetical protein